MAEIISNKTFKVLNTIADVIFVLSITGLIFYSITMGETIQWELVLGIVLLSVSYLCFFKKPDFDNNKN
ncbi:hypothetical protein [Oceanobacillus sp. J11TS1]|uniref:hypothetical protein n=1 Tax=Oceanobacillus sp. J11TS1 TaxID=2807191 RepID=UPI001AFDC79C|nr:hypothetical protein [Oceanobacillus sp. J11TS1]GIO21476.1 hypothetical protein J11TS1_00570 [Oceanobacillus sp. J11TS1]